MNAKTKPFRYNVGEAIIEPFRDPSVSGLKDWQLADTGAQGVKVTQYWCYVPYEWLRTAPDGTGVKLVRDYEDLCMEGYDALVLSAAVPENGFLQLTAVTDQGVKSARSILRRLSLRQTIRPENPRSAGLTGWERRIRDC